MVHARDLKFCMYILHENIVDPYFFCMAELCPFSELSLGNLVCKIFQKVLKLEPSNLVHWLGPRSR